MEFTPIRQVISVASLSNRLSWKVSIGGIAVPDFASAADETASSCSVRDAIFDVLCDCVNGERLRPKNQDVKRWLAELVGRAWT